MKQTTLIAALLLLAGTTLPATAATLHGYCGGGPTQCSDNGTVSPTTINPPTNFGFVSAPSGATGTLFIDILIPNNVTPLPASIAITGTNPGTATLFGGSAASADWTSGDLTVFLGRSTTPPNPLSAWLPSTKFFQPTATGYEVYDANLGSATLSGSMQDNLTAPLPLGSVIVAFLNEGTATAPNWDSTPQSAAIFQAPLPPAALLFGTALVGLGFLGRRGRKKDELTRA